MKKRPKIPANIIAAYRDMITTGVADRGYSLQDFLDEYFKADSGEWRIKKVPPVRWDWTRAGQVRAALDFEQQKFGHVRQRDFWDGQVQASAESAGVTVIGLNMTPEKSRVYHAFQTLLEQTSYLGTFKNADGTVNLPVRLFVAPRQWYTAYGLERRQTKRGKKEFSGWETRDAMGALFDAADERVIFWKQRGKDVDVTPRAPFVVTRHYENLTKAEARGMLAAEIRRLQPQLTTAELAAASIDPDLHLKRMVDTITNTDAGAVSTGKGGGEVSLSRGTDGQFYLRASGKGRANVSMPLRKLVAVTIEPAPELLEGIHNRFVLKSADYQTTIRQIAGKGAKSKYPVLLADYLFTHAAQKLRSESAGVRGSWTVRRRTLTLATELRMDARIKARQWSKIHDTLKRCAEILTEAGYLTGHDVEKKAEGETWVFHLNRDRYAAALNMQRTAETLERAPQRKKKQRSEPPASVRDILADIMPGAGAKPPPKPSTTSDQAPPKEYTPPSKEREAERRADQLRKLEQMEADPRPPDADAN